MWRPSHNYVSHKWPCQLFPPFHPSGKTRVSPQIQTPTQLRVRKLVLLNEHDDRANKLEGIIGRNAFGHAVNCFIWQHGYAWSHDGKIRFIEGINKPLSLFPGSFLRRGRVVPLQSSCSKISIQSQLKQCRSFGSRSPPVSIATFGTRRRCSLLITKVLELYKSRMRCIELPVQNDYNRQSTG
jgi:hypothetical protein